MNERTVGSNKAILERYEDGFIVTIIKNNYPTERRFGILGGAEAYKFFKTTKLEDSYETLKPKR